MTTPGIPPLRQASAPADQFPSQVTLLAASRLAKFARDAFWAAQRAGDRAAMVHWSAREIAFRRRVHGFTTLVPLPAPTRAVA